jgi:hypothetical protein
VIYGEDVVCALNKTLWRVVRYVCTSSVISHDCWKQKMLIDTKKKSDEETEQAEPPTYGGPHLTHRHGDSGAWGRPRPRPPATHVIQKSNSQEVI